MLSDALGSSYGRVRDHFAVWVSRPATSSCRRVASSQRPSGCFRAMPRNWLARRAKGRSISPTQPRDVSKVSSNSTACPTALVTLSLLRPRREIAGRRAEVSGVAPLSPRGLQMAELERAAGRASDWDGRVVGIVGEAGIGKSRLVDELLHSDAAAPFQVLTLSATANDKSTPFGPLRDFLADWAGRPAPVTPLADTLFDTAREQGIAAEHLPALRALAGATSANDEWDRWDGPVRRRRIVALIRTIVDTACRKAPLILVVEDLHWLDGETEQLLQALVDDLATLPLLMITTYRPDYAAEFVGRSVFHLVRLEPLSSSETSELVECLIGPDPETCRCQTANYRADRRYPVVHRGERQCISRLWRACRTTGAIRNRQCIERICRRQFRMFYRLEFRSSQTMPDG